MQRAMEEVSSRMEKIMQTDYFTLKKMAEGVFAAIAKPGTGAWSNAGFVDLGAELLVFDAFNTPIAAEELKKQAENLTGKTVKYLVNSHYHGDHVFGNQAFKECVIISTETTKELIKDRNAIGDVDAEIEETGNYLEQLQRQIELEKDSIIKQSLTNQYLEMQVLLTQIPIMKLTLPAVTFERKLVITGSERSIELHCLGGGHTPSDAFLYVPEEKALLMGDLVTENLHLPIFDPDGFLDILESVKELNIACVLPGHGDVGSIEVIDVMIGYLSMLKEASKKAISTGMTAEEFIASFTVPEEYEDWNGIHGVKRNLKAVYDYYTKGMTKVISQSI